MSSDLTPTLQSAALTFLEGLAGLFNTSAEFKGKFDCAWSSSNFRILQYLIMQAFFLVPGPEIVKQDLSTYTFTTMFSA